MKLEFLPKSFGRAVKYIVLAYALSTVVYTGMRFYNIAGTSHTRTTRRSIAEYQKDSFLVAPLSQQIIEDNEEDELQRNIYFDPSKTDVEQRGKGFLFLYYSKN
jgi:hypothetical protein